VVSLNPFCGFINKNTNCKQCGSDISFSENPSGRRGVASNLVINCCKRVHTADIMASNITRNRLDYHSISLMYGVMSVGKCRVAGRVLCAMLNIPQPATGFRICNKTVGSFVGEVREFSMMQAARESLRSRE
jgi:hypothetical protein